MEFFPDLYTNRTQADDSGASTTFLPDWSASHWECLLEHTQTQMYSAGDIIIRAGSDERALYLIAFGKLASFVNAKKRLSIGFNRRHTTPLVAAIETGAVINTLTFLDGEPSSVTYQARTESQLLYLSFDAFTVFAARHPELGRDVLLDLGRLLAQQVRQMSSLLTAYKGDK